MPMCRSSFAVRAISASAERWPGDQDQQGRGRVARASRPRRVAPALLLQARRAAPDRRRSLARFEKPAPGTGQLEQPDGVARRRRIEYDMFVLVDEVASVSSSVNSSKAAISVVQAPESCSSMLFSAFSGICRAWTDDPFAILGRCRFRIDLECVETSTPEWS